MKKILSFAMSVLLVLSAGCIPVFAQETIDEKYQKLSEYTAYVNEYYFNYISVSSRPVLWYTTQSQQAFGEPLKDSYALMDRYNQKTEPLVTEQEIDDVYNRLKDCEDNLVFDDTEVKILLEYCSEENNDDGYYPQELWNKFLQSFDALNDMDSTDKKQQAKAYWDLYFTYNELCAVNQTPGDVNFDGDVSIKDVSVLQMDLAKLRPLNSSQRTVAENNTREESISITDVTNLQMIVAKLQQPFPGENLAILNDKLYDKGYAPYGNNVSTLKREAIVRRIIEEREQA